jgi:hypothetical protein
MLKKIFITFIVCSFFTVAFASERTDAVFAQDAITVLDKLLVEKTNLDVQKEELRVIDKRIKTTRKGQSIYVEFRQIAGSIALVGIVIASYKAKIPPGLRAMLSSYITLKGLSHGMIKLSEQDISKLTAGIEKVSSTMVRYEQQIIIKKNYYCNLEPRHLACY